MNKNIIIGILIVLVILLGSYALWQNIALRNLKETQSSVAASSPSTYFDIPELGVRFTNVPGLTLHYILTPDGDVQFSSDQIMTQAEKDPAFFGCVTQAFSLLTTGSTPIPNGEQAGVYQIDLGNGKYLYDARPNGICYGDNMQDFNSVQESSKALLGSQMQLFRQFINSAQLYTNLPSIVSQPGGVK